MAIAFCPDCEAPIRLGAQIKIGQRIVCSNCDVELEVIEVSPVELDWAYDEPEEDWDDGEWDDEDDEEDYDDWDEDDWDEEEDDDDG
jgi:lysine biosynthesis protein LysW